MLLWAIGSGCLLYYYFYHIPEAKASFGAFEEEGYQEDTPLRKRSYAPIA